MQTTPLDRVIPYVRVLCIATFVFAFAAFIRLSLHWPWIWDTQVMHYTSFLVDHGKIPYRDIYDINMPGSYLTERWAIHIFGGGDVGWRLYEFCLLGTLTFAMIVIALPRDWVAGLMAGVLFSLLHGGQGAMDAAERDEVMTVLIFVGYACLFQAVRKRVAWWMLPFGFAFGIASLIKPTAAPLALALGLLALFVLKKEGRAATPYMLFALGGFAIAGGLLLNFLLPGHALGPLIFSLRRYVPFYSSLAHPGFATLVSHGIPAVFYIYMPIALVLALARGDRTGWPVNRNNWESWCLGLGFLFGIFSYLIQGKGYGYHQYTYLCFAFLWMSTEFIAALRDPGWRRNLGLSAMAFVLLFIVPASLRRIRQLHETAPYSDQLEQDLTRLGGSRLQGKVQCLDIVSGCLRALYRMNLVQSSGIMGDLIFFAPDDGKVVAYDRAIFWDLLHTDPPAVIVLSNEWYATGKYTFDKLNAWPQFRDYLDSAYTLDATRDFGIWEGNPIAYRLYVRKGMESSLGRPVVPRAPPAPISASNKVP
jgi:hypothetical protein